MASNTDVSVIDVYQRHGAAWAMLRNGHLIEKPWLDRFCALLPARAAVLDIGCGSGLPIAGDLIQRGFDVTGGGRYAGDACAVPAQPARRRAASRRHAATRP